MSNVTYKVYDLELKVLEEKCLYEKAITPEKVEEFIYQAIKPHTFPDERVYIIAVNVRGDVIGYTEHSHGGLTQALMDIPQIFRFALLSNASAILMTHNHPSGDPNPSEEDIEVTKQIQAACDVMKIKLLDHIITTSTKRNFSFREQSLI